MRGMQKNTLRRSMQCLGGCIAFLLLSVPSALTQSGVGVSGILLESAPNAISVRWNPMSGMTVRHYSVSYAKQSITENNGRFDGQENTLGTETDLILLDLQNRGFIDGDTIFITVTAVDANGAMSPLGEEKSIRVQVPGTSSATTGGIVPSTGAPGLDYAIAQSLTQVTLHFSVPVTLPTENPAAHFSITEEVTTMPVGILSAVANGQDVLLTTLPMTPRGRYALAISDLITTSDGTPIDQSKRSTVFIARGDEAALPSSSSSSSVPPVVEPEVPVLELPPPPDTTSPEPPRGLTLRKVLQKDGNYTVHASWEESLNTEGDLALYHLYESDDRGLTFVGPTALAATIVSATIANVPPGTLTVQLTALDEVPNESESVEETIILPETGAALLLGISLLGAAVGAVGKKRK